MVHVVYNDDVEVNELSKEIRNVGVNFKNHFDRNVESERYMSSKEFRKHAIEKVNKFCDKHGIL